MTYIITQRTVRKVTTLGEARAVVSRAAAYAGSAQEHEDALIDFDALPDAGGTVGPLPDGTVIEVRRA